MRKWGILFALLWFAAVPLAAQPQQKQKRENHEYYMDIPVYVDSIQATLSYPLAWRNFPERNLPVWQKIAREKVWEMMGPLPPRSAAFDMQVEACESRDGYDAMRISVQLTRWYRVKGYLLVPHGEGKHPAINLLHDHGAHLFIGKEKMIRPFACDSVVLDDADRWAETLYDGQYVGDYLARHGYVVLSMDAPLWGERGRKEGVDRSKYDIIAGNMMMLGQDLCAYMHYDDYLATEFLATLPQVDSLRMGAGGCSMGAYRAWMLAALNPRIKATAAVCWMTTTAAQLTTRYGRKENGGFANCIPGLRRYMDYPDIASLAVPNRMLMINGTEDKLFKIPGVEAAYQIMRQVWTDYGAADKFECQLLKQGHECNRQDQQAMLLFFDKAFKAKEDN